VKVGELLTEASPLEDLVRTLLLVKHGGLSKEQAAELVKALDDVKMVVGGKQVDVKLRWVEDTKTGTLKFVSSTIPGSWRSGTAAVGRARLRGLLRRHGFTVAPFASQAVKRQSSSVGNGPHIFFWGPGTPPADPENFEKVGGTDEASAALEKRVRAASAK
jgi:hypothetical protein